MNQLTTSVTAMPTKACLAASFSDVAAFVVCIAVEVALAVPDADDAPELEAASVELPLGEILSGASFAFAANASIVFGLFAGLN